MVGGRIAVPNLHKAPPVRRKIYTKHGTTMNKRDFINEIIEKRSRLEQTHRMENLFKRLFPLVSGFRAISALDEGVDYKKEWLKYSAIGYIACLEGYFRLLIADLINYGEPYVTNVKNFKDIRFSIENMVAISLKKVTLGDYISHLLPINSIQDINSNLSIILNVDFVAELKDFPCHAFNDDPVFKVFPDIVFRPQKLFELRHLYCHELATKIEVNATDIEHCISTTAAFILFTEELIKERYLNLV